MKANLTARTTWLRAVYMILFGVAFDLAELVVGAIALVQFLFALFSGRPVDRLALFGAQLAAWIGEIVAFLTFASEALPFPFAPWPDARPDVLPPDDADPVAAVQVIERELEKFSAELAARERWLVINKIDLVPDELRDEYCADIVRRLDWSGPVFRIAAIAGEGTRELTYAIMEHLEQQRAALEEQLPAAASEADAAPPQPE